MANSVAVARLVCRSAVVSSSPPRPPHDPTSCSPSTAMQRVRGQERPAPRGRLAVPAYRLGRPRPRPGRVPQRGSGPPHTPGPDVECARYLAEESADRRRGRGDGRHRRGRRRPASTRRSRRTRSSSVRASTGSPSSPTSSGCRPRAPCSKRYRRAAEARARDGQPGWRLARAAGASRRTPALAAEIAAGRWRHEPYAESATAGVLDPRTLSIALDDLLPTAHGRGGLRRLHGLAVDVPRRARRGRLRLPAGLSVRRPRASATRSGRRSRGPTA